MDSIRSLLWRNALFTLLQPGVVAVLIPLWIAHGLPSAAEWSLAQGSGLIVFASGGIITLSCIFRFASEGKGTLSPADPTRRLVIHGLYRYSRNPMYVGVFLMLLGDGLLLQRRGVWIYAVITFVVINVFVVGFEEPRLRRDFGEEYNQYCRKVRRWL